MAWFSKKKASKDPVGDFLEEAQRRARGLPDGSRFSVDIDQFMTADDAQVQFMQVLMRSKDYGLAVLDGETRNIEFLSGA